MRIASKDHEIAAWLSEQIRVDREIALSAAEEQGEGWLTGSSPVPSQRHIGTHEEEWRA